jgi:hypothetical protein
MTSETWCLTAAEIARVQHATAHGPLEQLLLRVLAEAHRSSGAAPVLMRVTFPGGDIGGVELEVRQSIGWRARVCTWLVSWLWRQVPPLILKGSN